MSIIAGSYERFIWGFKLKPTKHDADNQTLILTPLFSYPSHISPITTVACSGPAAASGGSDDTIHLYDLPSASSLGSLLDHNHTASITALSFYTPSSLSFPRNLISAAADGSVAIFDTDPFVLLKSFRPHKKAVNDLAIHPSGKLALAVYRDEFFTMLNLVRGKRSFCCRLGHEASLVKFDPSGESFFMVVNNKVGVHQSEDAKLLLELENPSRKRILCATPGESGTLFTGGEDRAITAWDTNSGKLAYSIEDAHPARIKGIVVLTRNESDGSLEDPYLIGSASSDGIIRVWDVRMAAKENTKPLAETNTKSRLTCLAGSALRSMRRPQIGKQQAQKVDEGQEN
ncbi:PREDICTED: p21-activated protein kinase-interacting protein 1-like [Camelina sativa]|uniref:P21-activated protein kinase-interacting protein 1-like n=2 Tax=Camelina sativa TaxID=90675 RepID=A0ABM0SQV3_CAMSA|nr:PREDICTED: p21-activated protein kinase-interacting protein 1-like [Camelina sativa]